jgi:polyisoprenyl-phosphate glycosyltransferase
MHVKETTAAESHDPSKGMDDIAVIVPVYMGRAMLRELCARLIRTLGTITARFSIVLVDDRSPDDVWPLIQELGRTDRRISRNFGQRHALT